MCHYLYYVALGCVTRIPYGTTCTEGQKMYLNLNLTYSLYNNNNNNYY